jgi:hypothetical protein
VDALAEGIANDGNDGLGSSVIEDILCKPSPLGSIVDLVPHAAHAWSMEYRKDIVSLALEPPPWFSSSGTHGRSREDACRAAQRRTGRHTNAAQLCLGNEFVVM